ncbi:MAG: hypothetical protein LC624_04135 [Halobacteriales archaeon]|nr:hypothetical protein [Halobacteriales archaeon]
MPVVVAGDDVREAIAVRVAHGHAEDLVAAGRADEVLHPGTALQPHLPQVVRGRVHVRLAVAVPVAHGDVPTVPLLEAGDLGRGPRRRGDGAREHDGGEAQGQGDAGREAAGHGGGSGRAHASTSLVERYD